MSQECYDKLVAELRHMEQVELPQVRDAIAEARDKGDLSENFEYHAAKREQSRLLGRISYKQKVLENALYFLLESIYKSSHTSPDTAIVPTLQNGLKLSAQPLLFYFLQKPQRLCHHQSMFLHPDCVSNDI